MISIAEYIWQITHLMEKDIDNGKMVLDKTYLLKPAVDFRKNESGKWLPCWPTHIYDAATPETQHYILDLWNQVVHNFD